MSPLDSHRGGSGEPLVLLHGIGHTWRGWKPMLPQLETSFDVLALDLPGFGHSSPLPAGVEPTPEALGDAVEEAMDEAGFTAAHLAGNSLGGWIALELARRERALTVTAFSPGGLQHRRERAWGKNVLLGMRWIARKMPAPEALLRTRSAGRSSRGRPWGRHGVPIPTMCSSRRSCSRVRLPSTRRSRTRSTDRCTGSTRSTARSSCSGVRAI